ncbi:alpha/beta hydrolase [Alicyclobacillus mengziensis]|uniref:Alpha/beta hydrolase n=1 Tax=Alicyclobacillus mengziensis TaxID=2931921 RepID=A0A9X7VZE8_9BACL|nr:alpha/beta hydrolase domain-containing protein [Alicyclobacillus mengziensis]QSO47876.1 alpha/beta hydrolase [Alicyclobacillus mengziensis]
MEPQQRTRGVEDLTTAGCGIHPDAQALVYRAPDITKKVPGTVWTGQLKTAKGPANAVVRMPRQTLWNGKLMIGGSPAVRSEYALDMLLSDIVLQAGYAFAACDKATPGLILLDPSRSMEEWVDAYGQLQETALKLVHDAYERAPERTYIAGVSNGGYVTRRMLELHPEWYDGGVEWEGVLWNAQTRHLLSCLPVYVQDYPVYSNWRGDRTSHEQNQAFERLLAAGLNPNSSPYWGTYFQVYWVLSLWLYGRNLDPDWEPFASPWSNDWLHDPSPLSNYPWQKRMDILAKRIDPIANSGRLEKPLLSVAGNWDCLVAFEHNAAAYARLVEQAGAGKWHRLYEIEGGNHVDGLLKDNRGAQQPVLPYFEAAMMHLERWVEEGILPPESGQYDSISQFAPAVELKSGALRD